VAPWREDPPQDRGARQRGVFDPGRDHHDGRVAGGRRLVAKFRSVIASLRLFENEAAGPPVAIQTAKVALKPKRKRRHHAR
jgi:hypothetical protein